MLYLFSMVPYFWNADDILAIQEEEGLRGWNHDLDPRHWPLALAKGSLRFVRRGRYISRLDVFELLNTYIGRDDLTMFWHAIEERNMADASMVTHATHISCMSVRGKVGEHLCIFASLRLCVCVYGDVCGWEGMCVYGVVRWCSCSARK